MIRIAVAGASGRMGKAIMRLAHEDPQFRITGVLEHPQSQALGEDVGKLIGVESLGVTVTLDPFQAVMGAHALIDFTHPSATESHLKAVMKNKVGYVIGTTGLTDSLLKRIKSASKSIPIVQSPNMSVGVNLLFKLAEITGKALDEDYDIEIVEAHHRMKKDAPSGTALKLLEVLTEVRNRDIKKNTVYGREGEVGARPKGQIGVSAVRGGDVVGDHTVSFLADGERVELVHKASSRDAFAQGALRASKFLAKRKSGLFNMLQVLGLA